MTSLSDLMLRIMLPLIGMLFGSIFPVMEFGLTGWIAWVCAIPFAVTGWFIFAYVGAFLDGLLEQQMIRHSRQKLAPISTPELVAQLDTTLTPNFVLLELAMRGENLSNHLETMLSLLENPVDYQRRVAWIAFQ